MLGKGACNNAGKREVGYEFTITGMNAGNASVNEIDDVVDLELPVGIAKLNGVIRLEVIQESEQDRVPFLLTIRFQDAPLRLLLPIFCFGPELGPQGIC